VINLKYIITSALPYVHGIIHLGNFVSSILPADITGKFLKLKGEKCLVICGSDMHGAPGELAAIKQGISPKEYMLKQHELTKEIIEKLECTFDHYGHTDTEENKEIVYLIFDKLLENGYIIEGETIVSYCNNCKRYIPDRYVEGKCPKCGGLARGDQCDDCGQILDPQDLIDPYCVLCKKHDIEFRKVKQLLIDIPKLEKELREFYGENHKNWSKIAQYETKRLLNELKPRSITRHLTYGFRVPLKGYENQVFYVWFDAPIGYIGITAEKFDWKEWWLDKDTFIVHFIGPDNIYFHTILWPAILIGSKLGFTLPKIISATRYLKAKDVKFSKSRGKGLNCLNALEYFHPDYIRYYLAKIWNDESDMIFSLHDFYESVNKELINNIANFILRVTKLAKKKLEGKLNPPEEEFKREIDNYAKKLDELYYSFTKFKEIIKTLNELAQLGNKYLNETEPWKKENPIKELSNANYIVTVLIFYLYPICPSIKEVAKWYGKEVKDIIGSTEIVGEPKPIYKPIDEKIISELKIKFSETETCTYEDFKNSGLFLGKIKHVQKLKSGNYLIVFEDGKKTVFEKDLSNLKGKYVLCVEYEKEVEKDGEKINCEILVVDGKIGVSTSGPKIL